MIAITPKEVALFADFIHRQTGIVLDSSKGYLLESRLGPLLADSQMQSFSEFFAAGHLRPEWVGQVVDAISTHETSFFRDHRPFELLQNTILPSLFSHRPGNEPPAKRTILSAACSTGQEVYSLAMTIAELLGNDLERWPITITGLDVSELAINKARQGRYSKHEVERGLPPTLRQRYFTPQGDGWQIRHDLQAMTTFSKNNLLTSPTPEEGYDLILCCNVAIYFNQENRCRLFAKIAAALRQGGMLIIDATESLLGISDLFTRHESCHTVFFEKK